MKPLRWVTESRLAPHTSIFMHEQDPHRKTHFWRLTLECGHQVERWIRWLPDPDGPSRGWAAFSPSLARLPEPPKRARCDECPEVAA